MADDRNISLDVHNHASSGSDGYINTIASDNAVYSYKYSGGTGNGGDVSFTSRGRVNITVKLTHGTRYQIGDVSFANDTNHQLSWLNQNAPYDAVIQNENNVVQTADYKVTVNDSTANCTVPCDPQIINK